jgi:hypothetical protein
MTGFGVLAKGLPRPDELKIDAPLSHLVYKAGGWGCAIDRREISPLRRPTISPFTGKRVQGGQERN